MPGILEHATLSDHGLSKAEDGGPALPGGVPVLIVGGGPTGLLSAYMLSKFGSKYRLRARMHHLWLTLLCPSQVLDR